MMSTKNEGPVTGDSGTTAAHSWGELQWQGDLPLLEDFLGKVAARVACWDRDLQVAVGVPPEGASFLTTNQGHRSGTICRLKGSNLEPAWDAWPGEWTSTADSAASTSDSGKGPWPSYWALPGAPEAGWRWHRLTVHYAGTEVMMALVLGADATELTEKLTSRLASLQEELTSLVRLWVGARRFQARHQRLQTENQALARLNALQEKAVALTSHEFKTPLTSITAYTDALRDQVTDADFPHAAEFLGVIRAEAGRLLRLVNQISDRTRLHAGLDVLDTELVEVAPLVDEISLTLGPAVASKGLRMRADFDPHLPPIVGDADLIRQVLVNLMSNAIKYTPDGGDIDVRVLEREGTVRIEVNDTGVGIAEDELQKIFREYYRDRQSADGQEGTGLGLSIVRSIVNLHGGFVTVKRRQEVGTSFGIHFPKEVRAENPLPLEYTSRVDRDQAWRLISLICRMTGELTGSRAVEVQLNNTDGKPETVATMGMSGGAPTEGHWLAAEIQINKRKCGTLRIGRPHTEDCYGPAKQDQLRVIADATAMALSNLTQDSQVQEGNSASAVVIKVCEALQAITQIKWTGLPTSTSQALALTSLLARELGMDDRDTDRLRFAALVHDAGMARVEVEITMGASALTWDQRDEVERHVEQGLDLMSPLLPDDETRSIIRHHHERVDGRGYPAALEGKEIPLGARLLAVIDTWFALNRERTFRPGLAPEAAMQEIKRYAGTQFDPAVVQALDTVLRREGILPGSPARANP